MGAFLMPFACVGVTMHIEGLILEIGCHVCQYKYGIFRSRQGQKAGRSVKKISVNPVSKDTLGGSVSEYVCVVKNNIVAIRNVRWSQLHLGVFYISENCLERPVKMGLPIWEKE